MNATSAVLLCAASAVAGAINAVAGGGTLISFPAAIAAGLTPIVANATNAVALTPAALASAWGYRREFRGQRHVVVRLLAPTLVGGLVGAALLLLTPQRVFMRIVPLLVLAATALLFAQNLWRRAPDAPSSSARASRARTAFALVLAFATAVYGGYFGAGMGIVMLATLTLLAPGESIHRLNAVKVFIGAVVNGIASVGFIAARAVDARAIVVMAIGASAGGVLGAAVGRRIDARVLRWVVVAIGAVLTIAFAYQALAPAPPPADRPTEEHAHVVERRHLGMGTGCRSRPPG